MPSDSNYPTFVGRVINATIKDVTVPNKDNPLVKEAHKQLDMTCFCDTTFGGERVFHCKHWDFDGPCPLAGSEYAFRVKLLDCSGSIIEAKLV